MSEWYPTENDEKINDLMIQLREARAEIEMLMKWQPIKTAPKDGDCFIAYIPHTMNGPHIDLDRIAFCGFQNGTWVGSYGEELNPILWMPAPEFPKNNDFYKLTEKLKWV